MSDPDTTRSAEGSTDRTHPEQHELRGTPPLRPGWQPYAVAVLLVAATMAVRLLLAPWIGNRLVLILFMIPIIISAAKGGLRPGLAATALTAISTLLLIILPASSAASDRPMDFVQWMLLVISGTLISLLTGQLHAARRHAEEQGEAHLGAQSALRSTERQLRTVIQHMSDGLLIMDTHGKLLHTNPAASVMHGFDRDAELSEHLAAFIDVFEISTLDGRVLPVDEWPLSRLSAGEALDDVVLRVRRRDVDWERIFSYGGARVEHAGSEPLIYLTMTDVTERQQTQTRLYRKEEHTQSLLRLARGLERADTVEEVVDATAAELAASLAFTGTWIEVLSDDHETMTLAAASTPLRDRIADGMPFDMPVRGNPVLEEVASMAGMIVIEDARTDPRTNARRVMRFDNRTIVSVPVFLSGGGLAMLGTGTFGDDGTRTLDDDDREYLEAVAGHMAASVDRLIASEQRKRAESDLHGSEARFATVFQASPIAMTLRRFDDDRFVEVNNAFVRMTGYTRDEVLGRTPVEVGLTDIERVAQTAIESNDASRNAIEVTLTTKSGERHTVVKSTEPLDLDGIAHILTISVDVTDQRALEAQLRQSQKMESIGLLAGGVAHDFNNLLTVILGSADLALSAMPESDPTHPLLAHIRDAGNRAAELTRQLLAFSRQQVMEPRVLDLNAVIIDMQGMLARLLGEDVDMTTALASDLRRIRVDPGHLTQVVMNLAVNARDAMPVGGKLTIETRNVDFDAVYMSKHSSIESPQSVMLAISDSGGGMSTSVQARLFEPFFTTKRKGHGTGLGLSVAHGIVAQSGGRIEVYSEEGIGTTFKIYFPAVDAPYVPLSEPTEPASQQGSETVLVVEDEPQVRAIAVITLRSKGYTVLEAENGMQALAVLGSCDGAVDAMLTDVVMPSMSGRELAEIVAEQYPDIRILFTSGYTDDAMVRHGILAAEVAFLQKPYSPVTLARKIREVLGRD